MSQEYQQSECAEFQQSACQNRNTAYFLPWLFYLTYGFGATNDAGFLVTTATLGVETLVGSLVSFTTTTWSINLSGSLCNSDPPDPLYFSIGNFELNYSTPINGVWLEILIGQTFTSVYVRGMPGAMTGTGSFHRKVSDGIYAPAFLTRYINGTVYEPDQGVNFQDTSWMADDIFCFWVGKTVAELPSANFNPDDFLQKLPTSVCS